MFAFGSWQGTAGSQRLELTVANVGTTGYHCKELPVPSTRLHSNCLLLDFANLGTKGYHCKELPVPKVGTDGSQRGNHHGKELPVPRP